VTTCPTCHRDIGRVATRGPLRVTVDPCEAYWRGLKLDGVTPAQARILYALAERGRASRMALEIAAVGEHSTSNALGVQICILRRRLPREVTIVAVTGWGYRLVLALDDAG